MRISAIILLGLYASAGAAAQPVPSACDRIQKLNGRIATQQSGLTRLLRMYTEKHPEVLRARSNLTSLQASRAAEVDQAKSQGLSCASATQPEAAMTSSDNPDAAKKDP